MRKEKETAGPRASLAHGPRALPSDATEHLHGDLGK